MVKCGILHTHSIESELVKRNSDDQCSLQSFQVWANSIKFDKIGGALVSKSLVEAENWLNYGSTRSFFFFFLFLLIFTKSVELIFFKVLGQFHGIWP